MITYKLLLLFQDTKTKHMIKTTLITNTPISSMRDTIKEYTQSDYKFIQFIVLSFSTI